MSNPAAYNLAPLAGILAIGLLLAAAPVWWAARKHRRGFAVSWQHALGLVTLFLTFDLVVFGAFTRLTDSGLGCPDWPGCYGSTSPVGASASIAQAQTALPDGPVTVKKAWIEMIHRFLATGVGALILILAVAAWKDARRSAVSPWLATGTLLWVCLQGAFGALTVTMKLFPAIVTLHLLGGMVLLALLVMQVAQAARGRPGDAMGKPGTGFPLTISPGMARLLYASAAALTLQIALGGWVSTNYAVLVCNDFPQCQGRFWPVMNFGEGFGIWRELGHTTAGDVISFPALTAIHFTHRMVALPVVLLLAALALRLNRTPGLRQPSRWIAALVGLQVASGLGNVVLGWPLLAALLHTAGAAGLVMALTWTACKTRIGVVNPAQAPVNSGTGVMA